MKNLKINGKYLTNVKGEYLDEVIKAFNKTNGCCLENIIENNKLEEKEFYRKISYSLLDQVYKLIRDKQEEMKDRIIKADIQKEIDIDIYNLNTFNKDLNNLFKIAGSIMRNSKIIVTDDVYNKSYIGKDKFSTYYMEFNYESFRYFEMKEKYEEISRENYEILKLMKLNFDSYELREFYKLSVTGTDIFNNYEIYYLLNKYTIDKIVENKINGKNNKHLNKFLNDFLKEISFDYNKDYNEIIKEYFTKEIRSFTDKYLFDKENDKTSEKYNIMIKNITEFFDIISKCKGYRMMSRIKLISMLYDILDSRRTSKFNKEYFYFNKLKDRMNELFIYKVY